MKHLRRSLCLFSLVAFLLLLLCYCSGCAHTEKGIERERAISTGAEAVRSFIERSVAPMVPAPYSGAVNLALGAAGAGLAAWSLSQEKRLAALKAAQPAKT